MTIECPKCQTNNPDSQKFCGECATPLPGIMDAIHTKTLETPKEELNRGSTIADRYEIIEELGKGGMGRVYRVEDKKVKEEVALKLIKAEIASDKNTIERFSNELKLARKITHKNVCRMYDLGEEKDRHYITMEYVSGQDLKEIINQMGQLTVGKAISIAKQICDGLTEAHNLGIIHRDLKPNNIMIDRVGNAKIMDFGIARAVKGKSITGSGVMIGTPQYMSPEQVEGKEVDLRSDIYSLGILLYEMLTDRVPFDGDTPLTIGIKQKTERPRDPRELNERIPDDLSHVILKCLAKDSEDRYQSAEDVKSDLGKLEQGLPSTDRVVPKKKPLTSREITVQFSLKKTLIPALVVAVLAVTVLVVWSPWKKKTPSFVASDRPSLAVLFFRNGSGDPSLDNWKDNLCEYFIFDLSQSKFIHVLDFSRIVSMLEKHDLLEANRYSIEDLTEIASAGGVTHILTGSFSRPGEFYRIDCSLHDFRKGGENLPDRLEGKGDDFNLMVDSLTRKIKGKLDLTQAQIDSDIDKEIGIILTADPEAYEHYREGKNIFHKGLWRESIPAFKRAVAIDPGFAMAYRALGSAYINLGEQQKADECTQLAMDNIDRLSYLEQMIIKGRALEGGVSERLEWYKNLYKDYPENIFLNSSLSFLYYNLEEWDLVIEHNEFVRKLRGEFVWDYLRLGEAYCAKRMYAKALEVYQDYIENLGDSALVQTSIGLTHAIEGNYEQASIAVDRAIELDPVTWKDSIKGIIFLLRGDYGAADESSRRMLEEEIHDYQFWGRLWREMLYRTQGQFGKAAEEARTGLRYADENSLVANKATFTRVLSRLNILTDDMNGSLEKADLLWDIATDESLSQLESHNFKIDTLRRKIHAYLELHDLEKAEETLEEMKTFVDDSPRSKDVRWYMMSLGLIEVERNNYSEAVDLFTKAYEMQGGQNGWTGPQALMLYNLALAYYLNGDLESAKREYANLQALTTGKLDWGDLYVKSYYQLGKIHEQQGNTAQAIDHYEKFLDLWKDADPGLPELKDAKKRLAALKNL